jgi:hypothetical protein
MTKRSLIALAAALALVLPAPALAQIGIGARAGTIGVGGEVSFGIGSRLGIRGGLGVLPSEITTNIDDVEYSLKPPSNIWNVGLDFYPTGGGFRISVGVLSRKQVDMSFSKTGTQRVGDTDYTGTIVIDGTLTNAQEIAPYGAIGFGKTFAKGFGFFLDIGAAKMGEAQIELTGTCTQANGTACPGFPPDLSEEEELAEDDAGGYIEWHPILQIGLKIGLGK